MTTSAAQGRSLEPDVVRLPAAVLEAAYFEVAGDDPVTFDLTATRFVASPALLGLLRTLRVVRRITLVLPPGPVCKKIRCIFAGLARQVSPCGWELSL